MSSKKSIDVKNIVERVKDVVGVKTDSELAKMLNISSNTISMWRSRGHIDFMSIIHLCEKVNMDWLIFGRGEMYSDMKSPDTVKGKILTMLDDMDEEQQREILKSIEKEKLIEELLEERRRAS